MCLEPLHFALRLFRLLHLFLCRSALLANNVLEVEIDFRVFTTLNSALGLIGSLFVIRWREYDKKGVDARTQIRQAKFASAICLDLLLCALVTDRSNGNFRPGLPIHIQDVAADRAPLVRRPWCKYAC